MSDNWKTLGMQFATEGFEVHLLDLRNHGRSFHAEFSYDDGSGYLEYCNGHNLTNIDMIGIHGGTAMLLQHYIRKW
jgi:pimeloyl-ACP methyl ester carboxylesterase